MRQIIIGNKDYTNKCEDGFVITSTKSEELDSAVIKILGIKKTIFKPFTDVQIQDGTTLYLFNIDTYLEEELSKSPLLYSYTISLISDTKILERITTPNLTITKTLTNEKNITYYEFMEKILDLYVRPKLGDVKFYNRPEVVDQLKNLEAPEMAWATPNVKTIFNDLLGTLPNNPCLCQFRHYYDGNVVKYTIDFLQLAKKGKDISNLIKFSDTNYMTGKDYANSLVSDLKNVIPQKINTKTVHMYGLRTENVGAVTTQNVELFIPNAKFESIDKIAVYCKITYNPFGTTDKKTIYTRLNIQDYIVEQSVYQTYKVSNAAIFAETGKNYKRNALYFQYGGNKISGLNYQDSTWFLEINSKTSIENIIALAFVRTYPNLVGGLNSIEKIDTDIRDLKFDVTYKNQGDLRVKTYRNYEKEVDLELVDNQNVDFVNMLAFAQAEREKINRLGNEIKKIGFTVYNRKSIPELGDYVRDFILAKREMSCYNDHLFFNCTFSKNFIQKNVYYGLNQRTRFTQFAQSGNILVRDDISNINIYFDKTNHTNNEILSSYIARGFQKNNYHMYDLEPLPTYYLYYYEMFPKIIKAQTTFKDGTKSQEFLLQPSIYTGDYFTTISCKCMDNIYVGQKIVKIGGDIGVRTQEYISYVDNNGEFENIDFTFYSNLKNNWTISSDIEKDFNSTDSYPNVNEDLLDLNSICFTETDVVKKDNREIMQRDFQFNFLSRDPDIIIGSGIGQSNPLCDISTEGFPVTISGVKKIFKSRLNYRVVFSTTEKYKKGDLLPKGNYQIDYVEIDYTDWENWAYNQSIGNATYNNKIKLFIENPTTPISQWLSWGIVDIDTGYLIIGVNRSNDGQLAQEIYVNV